MADSPEQEKKNRELIEALRKTIEPLTKGLTPDVEPAVVYVLGDRRDDCSRDR